MGAEDRTIKGFQRCKGDKVNNSPQVEICMRKFGTDSSYMFAERELFVQVNPKNLITINAPLILKVGILFFFFAAKLIMGHFRGVFRGG
jgi:hypothetical protein